MNSFELAYYLIFQNDILDRFNSINYLLQDPKMVLQYAVTALIFTYNFLFERKEILIKNMKKQKKMSRIDYIQSHICLKGVRFTLLGNTNEKTASQLKFPRKK